MPVNKLKSDSLAAARKLTLTPANVEIGDGFGIRILGTDKEVSVIAAAATALNVSQGLATRISESSHPEFQEFTATVNADGQLILTANTPGYPFLIETFTTNSSSAARLSIVETVKGVAPKNKILRIKLDGVYSGGTFDASNDFGSGTETAEDIPYNATNAQLKAALVADMASLTTADLDVTGVPGDWYVEMKGAYAATNVSAFVIDGSNLTGTNDVNIETLQQGFGGADCVYLLSTIASGQAGTFTFSINGQTTTAIVFNPTKAALQAALEAIPFVGAGNVEVFGFKSVNISAPGSVLGIRFIDELAGTDVTMTMNGLSLAIPPNPGSSFGPKLEKIVAGGAAEWPEIQIWDLGGTTVTPSGTSFWNLAVEGNSTIYQSPGFPVVNSTGASAAYLDPITQNDDFIALERQYLYYLFGFNPNLQADITFRHFVAGNGFVLIFDGAAAIGNNYPSGQIGTAGVLTGLDRTASVETVIDGGSGSQNEIHAVHVEGSGGTWDTTVLGDQLVEDIPFGSSAAALEALIEAVIGSGNISISGTGAADDRYLYEYTGDNAATNVEEATADGSNLTGGSGTVTVAQERVVAVNEVQTLTRDPTVDGGSFLLGFEGEFSETPIDHDDDGATIEPIFEALATVPGISMSGPAGGPWVFTFDVGSLAGKDVPLIQFDDTNLTGGAGTQTLTIEETQRSLGPQHWNDPSNFSLGRVLEWGDDGILEAGANPLRYGGVWIRDMEAIDTDADTITLIEHDYVDGQKVRLFNTEETPDLPGGLAVDTDYYIIRVDHNTIQLSASRGGSAIDITDIGTGTHTVAVHLNSFKHYNRYPEEVGLPLINENEYVEYRPRYAKFGLLASGTKEVLLGMGEGRGFGKMMLDFADTEVHLRVLTTGGSTETDVPALLVLNSNSLSTFKFHDGSAGVAFHPEEVSEVGDIEEFGGELALGGVDVGSYKRYGGSLQTDDRTTLNGSRWNVHA